MTEPHEAECRACRERRDVDDHLLANYLAGRGQLTALAIGFALLVVWEVGELTDVPRWLLILLVVVFGLKWVLLAAESQWLEPGNGWRCWMGRHAWRRVSFDINAHPHLPPRGRRCTRCGVTQVWSPRLGTNWKRIAVEPRKDTHGYY